MPTTVWYDLNMRGRRLERIAKQMETSFLKASQDENKTELALSYLDRLIKLEHVTAPYVEQMTGMKKLLQQSRDRILEPVPARPQRLS
jgi:hypothetical protein